MVKRNQFGCVLWTFLFVLADLAASFGSICFHGPSPSFGHFSDQFRAPYLFNRSVFDFFVISVLRSFFISLGCAICIFKNAQASRTLAQLSQASFGLCILLCSFSPTKFLALSDNSGPDHPGTLFPGDIPLILANFIFSITAHRLWLFFLHTAQKNEYERMEEEEEEEEEEEGNERIETRNGAGKGNVRTFVIILRLLQYCRNEWFWHLSGFTWLFIYSLTRIFIPYFTGQVIASVVSSSGDKYASLISSVKLMLFISVISAMAGGLRGGSFEYAYSRFEVAFFDNHKTGEITSRLTADTTTMSDTIALNVNIFLRNTVQMGGSMLFMMTLCWRLSLVPFIVVPIILVASKIFGIYYDFLSEKAQDAVAYSNDVAEEVLSTMRTVRSFACEEYECIRFYDKLTDTLLVTKRKAVAYVAYLWLFQTIINVAVLWYGGHLVLTGQLQKDLLVSFLLYQMQLADNIRQLGEVWTGLMQSVGASRKVFEYIDRKPDIDTNGTYAPDKLEGRIEFQNVHFAYPTRPDNPILRGLSFTVEPGEVVALVGPSGSGKSSCIALLEHFYAPEGGKVLVDGVPIGEFDHHYIHNKLALVGQEPILFARSVAENIAYGLERCTIVDVVEAAKMANAHTFIQQTRDQYETNVGEKGSQMSGGQKQRIAIARALVRRPAILLLDEATSALDTESEHLVQEAIYKNLKGRSVILIAHRLSTVEKADKIVVISRGRLEQIGTHEQLLAQEGMYRSLVQRQMISVGDNGSELEMAGEVPTEGQEETMSGDGTDGAAGPSTGRWSRTRMVGDGRGGSPRTMAQSLLATSFTQSTSSLQSK
ncbi:hypothetical protein niasHS_017679 [Heterodera schachtii]|uniref:Uncharacterized protein n=1 Tax=Heterodera schachtii TaxID=97005 RepID=A0ABD2I692_HETSC